jgi:hypothetical protein
VINVSGASVAHVTPRLCVDGVGEALEQLSRPRRAREQKSSPGATPSTCTRPRRSRRPGVSRARALNVRVSRL